MRGHRPPEGLRQVLRAAATAAIAVLALSACGEEEDEASPQAEQSGGEAQQADRPEPAPPSDGNAGGTSEPPDEPAADEAAGCTFAAPPGRLAEDTIALRLDGVPCSDAMRAARAVALGQPAGANLVVRSAGFECEPSTLEKGVNVTYTCSGEAGDVTFDVVWSADGP